MAPTTQIYIGKKMLLNENNLKKAMNGTVRGVIHIGAHWGQEQDFYESLGASSVVYFEANPDVYKHLTEKMVDKKNVTCYNIALGSKIESRIMYCENSNNGQSSSFLPPKEHKSQHPWVVFDHEKTIGLQRLDDVIENKHDFNLMNIDVQGFELEVLRGSVDTLQHIDYIIIEVNTLELYENCPLFVEIESFLAMYGFYCNEKLITAHGWGDAFFVRNRIERNNNME